MKILATRAELAKDFIDTFILCRDLNVRTREELLKYKDSNFICSLKKEYVNLDLCTHDEIKYLTKISGLIDYYLQIHELEIPKWIRYERPPPRDSML